ncbi:MAG TPA: aromatic acid exporter family protein [Bacillota bacterium]|nr:aromatic acid exporter family protein [Bacillota bacterium]
MARIGLRNLKTALAVFICMLISKILKLEYPFFVAIAAIISMENSLSNSFKAGKSRMLGTIIGASIGLICALIRPGSALLSGIGIIGVIYLCNFLKWRKPISIAGIVFMAVMISLRGKNPFFYSINRITDTLIGIIVAVAVNYLIFPPDYLPRILRIISALSIKTAQIIKKLLNNDENVSLVEYEQGIAKANELWELSYEDNKIRKRKKLRSDPRYSKFAGRIERNLPAFKDSGTNKPYCKAGSI